MLPVLRKRAYFPFNREEFFGSDIISSLFSDGADYSVPAVNIKETENHFEIEVAAPGLRKEDFKINLEKNILTVKSDREVKKDEKMDNYMRREFGINSFCRSFSVPETVDFEKIKASHNNGILVIELPKSEKLIDKLKREITVS
jgi:HSP20 family protein